MQDDAGLGASQEPISPSHGMNANSTIPVVLITYARPAHLARTLAALKKNRVPLILAYSDGAKGPADAPLVKNAREILRAVDWCELRLVERTENLGLGRNVLTAVSDVAQRNEAFIVWEEDLVAVPGAYAWICSALHAYAHDRRVMSVTGWTHPRVTPSDAGESPYFDARAECWVWGAWARSWRGMDQETAAQKLRAAAKRGLAPDAYGADLPAMARVERKKNIWAVRWVYHHLEYGGLCVRPPWSMVEHIGFDRQASHAEVAVEWANLPLRPAPTIPQQWPQPKENSACRMLWKSVRGPSRWRTRARRVAKTIVPEWLRGWARAAFGWKWFEGDYATWADAKRRSRGYDDAAIVERVLRATCAVRDGRAAFERDGVTFASAVPEEGLVAALRIVAKATGGRLHMLDFGGALGTTYWRHRGELADLEELRWDVVEQRSFVAAGKVHLSGEGLEFFDSIEAADEARAHDVLLASTSLQYLEDPNRILERWIERGYPWLLFNNLPLHRTGRTRIAVQRVPPCIYPASYPVWFFNRQDFMRQLVDAYETVHEFSSEAVWPVSWRWYSSTGLLLRRKRKG
ncbi:methyltransferase, TIGR04325 family [Opitutus terrae]|uniref:Methyltransferase, TIGR04325 family n=1 Tax=Opitutus terrae (strain DSM 11246 / JCM 15787 / PB90-1) TaxID=452637 RepID=B1ZVW7_OPITP|nr:methyltransferase, TIGR04325 family [Opitutus terrae]ACB75053.1 hypothetical protein Oter_1769 [Opitutus terrae PB90-1]